MTKKPTFIQRGMAEGKAMLKKATTEKKKFINYFQPYIKKQKNGLWYATIHNFRNGKQVWKTGDGYVQINSAKKAINNLQSPLMKPIIIVKKK